MMQSCPRVGWTLGSGQDGSGHDFAGFRILGGRVSTLDFLVFTDYFLALNRYESSKTTFGLIDFLRYLIYNN